jgi:hypothetical protein
MEMSGPGLLRFRRGSSDWQKLFSRPPFRSVYFLIVTALGLGCLTLALSIIYRNGRHLSQFQVLALVMIAYGIVEMWAQRLRDLYSDGSITGAEPGTPLDVALGVAAGFINEILFSCFLTIAILLFYVSGF